MDLEITMKTLLVSFEHMNHPLVLRLSLSSSGSTIVDGCDAVKQPTEGRHCK